MILETERPKTINISFQTFKKLNLLKFTMGFKNFDQLVEELIKNSTFSKECQKCKFSNLISNKVCTKCGWLLK